jgi:hypothetical protein
MTDIDKTIKEAKAAVLPVNLRFNESWERLTGESGAAYAAFCSYRDYGPERNIRRVAEASLSETDRGKAEKRYGVWRNWSTAFRWRERAADYDLYLDRLKQTEKRKTIEAREEVYRETTGKMLQAVNKKLDLMNPEELTQGAVVEWLTTAISTDRDIAGIVAVSKNERESRDGKRPEIRFVPEFDGC